MKRRLAILLVAAAALALAGCAPTTHLSPASDANNPKCADVSVRLPDTLLTLAHRETDAQATAAWGDPTTVILRCGVKVPDVSSLPCVDVEGIDWLRDDSDAAFWTFTTYGHDPAIAVSVGRKQTRISAGQVLDTLSSQVEFLPPNGRKCVSTQDTVTGESLPPTDAPTAVPVPGESAKP